jgi:hypothetical protein
MIAHVSCSGSGPFKFMFWKWPLQIHVLEVAPSNSCSGSGPFKFMFQKWPLQIHVPEVAPSNSCLYCHRDSYLSEVPVPKQWDNAGGFLTFSKCTTDRINPRLSMRGTQGYKRKQNKKLHGNLLTGLILQTGSYITQ